MRPRLTDEAVRRIALGNAGPLGPELARDKAEGINWEDEETPALTLVREWYPDDTPQQQREIAEALDEIRGI